MNPPSDGPSAQRALSIDIFRGFALVFMVLLHFMIFFGNVNAMDSWLYFSFNHILGDWGASGFPMILFQTDVTIVVVSTLYYIYDIRRRPQRTVGLLAGFFSYISRSSLTFYFLHYLLIGWPLALIYIFSGTYPINDLMGSLPAFCFGLAAVGVLGGVLKAWEKIGNKYKLEWFLAALIRRFA